MSQHTSSPVSPTEPRGLPGSDGAAQPGGEPGEVVQGGNPSPEPETDNRGAPRRERGTPAPAARALMTSAAPRRGRPSLAPRPLPMPLQDLDGAAAAPPPAPAPASAAPIDGDLRVSGYLEELHRSGDPLLQQMEELALAERVPIVGPVVGALLRQIAQTIGARDIFVMGAGIGYATTFLARAVGDGGRVVHSELDARLSQRARASLEQAGLLDRVAFESGDAVDVLANYPGPFDLIFIDIDRERYPEALELARPRVRPGGYIMAADMLRHGRVVAAGPRDEATLGVLRYTRAALAAPDLLTTILPVGSGVALHLKLPEGKRRR